MASNPRGYAFIAFVRAYNRSKGYNWFATMMRAGLAPSRYVWIEDGLRMYDRMAIGIDPYDSEQNHEVVTQIVKFMSGSVAEGRKGRLGKKRGQPYIDRVFLNLDTLPAARFDSSAASWESYADRIPEPSDPFTEFDGWDALGFRLRRLWPKLSPAERRYVVALVDAPDSSMSELAATFGHTRQMADLTLSRVRVKAQKLESAAAEASML